MAVDLLVVTYNTSLLLKRLIDTLHSDWEPDVWELHVIDNGSTDDTREYLIEVIGDENKHITTTSFGSNIGYAKAVNYLSTKSKNEFLCAVNADAWFTTNHVKQVIQSFNETPEMAILGPKQMDEDKTIRHGGIFWDGSTNPIHRGWNELDPLDAKYKDKLRCWTVSGSLYYIRRSVWDDLTHCMNYQDIMENPDGAFLPTPHFFEETFCSVHAQYHGYQVWYDGKIETAGHTWGASEDIYGMSRRYFDISKDIYIGACDRHGIRHEYSK